MVSVRTLTAAFTKADNQQKPSKFASTSKSKRGGRRVNRHESFEDLFSGNAFGDEYAKSRSSDEVSLNSGQVNFAAPFSEKKLEVKKKSVFVGESDDEMSMSGDEDPFAHEKGRRGARKGDKSSDDSEYDAGSVDFNDGDFDQFQSQINDNTEGADQDMEASFSWTKPVSVVGSPDNKHDSGRNDFNSSFSKKPVNRKEKRHVPLSAIITASPMVGTPVSSIASSSVSGQMPKAAKLHKNSSISSPTSVLELEKFDVDFDTKEQEAGETSETSQNKQSEPVNIDTNTPEGVAGTYVMAPNRSRSRSRAASRSRTNRGASRSRSRARQGKQDEIPSMFPDVDNKGEEDLFADTVFATKSEDCAGRTSSRDPGSSARARSKSRSRTSSTKDKGTATDKGTGSEKRSSGRNVTRIKIRTKGNRKIDPETARKLIAEKMKQMKETGGASNTANLAGSMTDLVLLENGESANFSHTSLTLDESFADKLDLADSERKKEKKHKKKSKEGGEEKRKSEKESAENEESFTESSLSKSHSDSLNASVRFHESVGTAADLADSFHDSGRLPNVEESPLEESKERKSKSRSKSPEKKHKSRGRSESPVKRSKEHNGHSEEKKERSSRSRSPTKKSKGSSRDRSESPRKKGAEEEFTTRERPRSRSPTRKSKEDRARSKSRAKAEDRDSSKAPTKRSKEERARSKSRVRAEDRDRAQSKSRVRTEERDRARSKSRVRTEDRDRASSRSRARTGERDRTLPSLL